MAERLLHPFKYIIDQIFTTILAYKQVQIIFSNSFSYHTVGVVMVAFMMALAISLMDHRHTKIAASF